MNAYLICGWIGFALMIGLCVWLSIIYATEIGEWRDVLLIALFVISMGLVSCFYRVVPV